MIVLENVPATGPFGDKRNLRITIDGGRIEVINTLATEGDRLERPVYGYEPHLAAEVERLRASLMRLANEVTATMSLSEAAVRESAGNTNYACLMDAVSDARVALGSQQTEDKP